jgi:peptidoglycan/xylan/chitin deacetylase (PgdA/CDA1 family)
LCIPVLLYHQVGERAAPGATPTAVFHAHLDWLARRGWRSLTLREFEAAVRGQEVPGPRRFLLTFDDGYADLTHIAGHMEAFGFTGTAFLITGRQRAGDAAYLPPAAVRSLAARGTLEFQSHTDRHVRVAPAGAGLDALARDLADSRAWLADALDRPPAAVRHLAWPWGACTPAMESLARELGYEWQYLVQNGAVTRARDTLCLPRLCADGMPLRVFACWMSLLSSAPGARLANLSFGTVRRLRHGMAYL